MEQDDEEFEQLLGEIPRATSAPPHLEELQRAYGAELNNSPFVVSLGEGGDSPTVKPFVDIRCDEQYEIFYRVYTGPKKLPPPMENRPLQAEFPVSPKANSAPLSPFFGGLTLASPRSIAGLRPPRQKQESQMSANNCRNSGSNSNSVRTVSPPSEHQHTSNCTDDRSLASAFVGLNFDGKIGCGMCVGGCHHEGSGGVVDANGVGVLDHGVVGGGSSLSNGRGGAVAPIASGGVYMMPYSSGFPSEAAASLVDAFNRSPSATMELFSQKSATSPVLENPITNGLSFGAGGFEAGFDGHKGSTLDTFLRRTSPSSLDHNYTYQSTRNQNHGLSIDGLGSSSSSSSNGVPAAHAHPNFEAFAAALAAKALQSGSSNSVNGGELYGGTQGGVDNVSSARAFRAQKVQLQLEAEKQRMRERQYQQHLQEQQMRFYASLQATANAVHTNGSPSMGNGSTPYLGSRGHSPPEVSSSRQRSSLHPHAAGPTGALNNYKNLKIFPDQFWNLHSAAGVFSQNSAENNRTVLNNSICRYYAQGYCNRGDACPFLHTMGNDINIGRIPSASNFYDAISRDDRFLPDRLLNRPRIAHTRTTSGHAVPGANHPLQHRKQEGFANVNVSPAMNGHAHANGNLDHQGSPNVFSGDVAHNLLIGETLEYDDSWHPVFGSQYLPSHGQQQPQLKYNSLDEVEGRIFSIAKDQHGCRFLQRKFDEGGPDDVQKIFNEIIDHIIELMTDPFGNYLVQKLLEVCDEAQRMEILHVVTGKGELITISLNMHGTRAVQKLIETLKSPEQIAMVIAALKLGVVTLIKDLNGNHVVQRCLQKLSQEDSQFIFDAAALHCVEIATHRHGCCVLQRCVDHAKGPRQDYLVAEIAANALVLSQDPFGNYVVQYILDMDLSWAPSQVMARLENHYPFLAMQKFSSNVVEKCLKIANDDNRARVVRELMGSPRLGQMLQDPYANYVIQSVLNAAKGTLYAGFVEAIRPHLSVLRSSPYGKRILSRTNLKK